ncbi:iron donor protein CyaY protein [Cardiosporidium cionae]|uniref:Iron donor protein CyaY protein n=1 Tax=Cardiosporidium cionae TaxID=476202 RepID=A0ABQ7J4Y9_9APIC|nr:iron donor protein CyaY protein [Cardiosporidium cionae]|eukprot:KAF8819064.1 iron donor protein CyaY protein [Cardiosporidium cionae]
MNQSFVACSRTLPSWATISQLERWMEVVSRTNTNLRLFTSISSFTRSDFLPPVILDNNPWPYSTIVRSKNPCFTKRFLACVSSKNQAYQSLVEATLRCIHDELEGLQLDEVEELDFRDGVLSIDFGKYGTFVLNKHYITEQIWYSSPSSGAHYFEFTSHPPWISLRTVSSDSFLFYRGSLKSPEAGKGGERFGFFDR